MECRAPPGGISDHRPAIVRGLYGYEIEDICSEQTHTILYQGRRKIDGLKVLIKLFRKSPVPDWRADWLQRDYQIAQGLGASYAVKPLAFEQTDVVRRLFLRTKASVLSKS